MTFWLPSWKYDVKSKIRLRQSMRIYSKNNLGKFHPDPFWNDGALGVFEERCPNEKEQQQQQQQQQQQNEYQYGISSWSKNEWALLLF